MPPAGCWPWSAPLSTSSPSNPAHLFSQPSYLLTLEPTTSFWDCGEFIAVSYLLQVGHPPGAPLYQLLAHAFTWLAGGNTAAVAACCNALSAVAGGLTVMFLYWTLLLLASREAEAPSRFARRAALVGALCYLFCDTAWFSAVESEVYSLAMLLASAAFWAMSYLSFPM